MAKCLALASALTLLLCFSCSDDESEPPEPGGSGGSGAVGSGGEAGAVGDGGAAAIETPAGALIGVTMTSQVGVLLDEVPESIRERVAETLLAQPAAFFIERAKRQLTLTTYRLNFRGGFYDETEEKQQLPLPPDSVFDIELLPNEKGEKVYRTSVEGHDYVLADYRLKTVVVTDEESPGASEAALSDVGGTWDEPFILPVDPELLIQRTGFACMDEEEFPPNSVDSEDVEFFYDQECEVEPALSTEGCHRTELPDESCEDALSAHVGKIETEIHFERLEWDEGVAAANRVGKVETEGAADLRVVTEELKVNRLTYRYIEGDSCALAEKCVGAPGWRRLLQFNASEKNVGTEPVHIGDVDYYIDDPESPTPNANHHLYQYSACHNHYHFNYFATFSYGGDKDLGSKRAFCLESVARYANHEQSPTWSPYGGCEYQGISKGWGDQYNAGIECQWVDVTSVNVEDGPVNEPLGLRSNPEGFLCEGTPQFEDEEKEIVQWEPTDLKTDAGETVDRPVCEEAANWDSNNYGEVAVKLPVMGEGMITEPCDRGQIGPLRNCGYSYDGKVLDCEPGETVNLTCSAAKGSAPQAVRVCEASSLLGSGTACLQAAALGEATLEAGKKYSISFRCPTKRDAKEPGGVYSLYVGPVWPEDELGAVTCTPK